MFCDWKINVNIKGRVEVGKSPALIYGTEMCPLKKRRGNRSRSLLRWMWEQHKREQSGKGQYLAYEFGTDGHESMFSVSRSEIN